MATGVVAIWLWLLRGTFYRDHPAIAGIGAGIDLMIAIPILFWLVIGRRASTIRKEIATIALLGMAVTLLIVPGAAVSAARLVWLVELVLIGGVVWRLRSAIARSDRDQSLRMRIREIAREVIPFGPAADAVATEVALIAYAFSPKRIIEVTDPGHRWKDTDSWAGVVIGLGIAIIAESIGIHLWLHQTRPVLAWIVLALDLYGILWLAGDCRALSVSGAKIVDGVFVIDFGMRWRGRVPVSKIGGVERFTEDHDLDLKLSLVEDPDVVLNLRDPVTFVAVYGIRKRVRSLGLRLEDWSELADELAGAGVGFGERLPAATSHVPEPTGEIAVESEAEPRVRMTREEWLKTRPDFVPLEDWLRSKPPWVE